MLAGPDETEGSVAIQVAPGTSSTPARARRRGARTAVADRATSEQNDAMPGEGRETAFQNRRASGQGLGCE